MKKIDELTHQKSTTFILTNIDVFNPENYEH